MAAKMVLPKEGQHVIPLPLASRDTPIGRCASGGLSSDTSAYRRHQATVRFPLGRPRGADHFGRSRRAERHALVRRPGALFGASGFGRGVAGRREKELEVGAGGIVAAGLRRKSVIAVSSARGMAASLLRAQGCLPLYLR